MQGQEHDVVLIRPNRFSPASKTAKALVVLVLLVSVVLMLIVTAGGWSKLEGAKVFQLVFVVIYLVLALYVARWNRGVLPVIAALAIIVAVFAAVAGPAWFDRDKAGFAGTDSIFGGGGLDVGILGLLTLLIVPVQAVLIGVAMHGFRQNWQVEVEMERDAAVRKYGAAAVA